MYLSDYNTLPEINFSFTSNIHVYCFLCDPLHKCSNLEWLLIALSFALLSVDMYITYLAALS